MKIVPPWSIEQVGALNRWQNTGRVHPFTCGGDRGDDAHIRYADAHGGDFGQLVATVNGWFCPVCSYTQKWAHDFMCEDPPIMRGPFFEPKP